MSDHADTTPTKAVITSAEPQLFVADIKTSCDFFSNKLGFGIEFTYGTPPFYAKVKRNSALVNLRCVEQPVIDAGLRDREQLLSASLTVATAEEIKQLFLESDPFRLSSERHIISADSHLGAREKPAIRNCMGKTLGI